MGYDQFGFEAQAAYQLNCVFYPFSFNDPGGLKDKIFIVFYAKGLADVRGIFVNRRRRIIKIHDIRHDR